jgi:hypothetical protein
MRGIVGIVNRVAGPGYRGPEGQPLLGDRPWNEGHSMTPDYRAMPAKAVCNARPASSHSENPPKQIPAPADCVWQGGGVAGQTAIIGPRGG